MTDKQIKRFLKSKGIKYQEYELTNSTCKKDDSSIQFLKYILNLNK
jgi:hypothetical protein